MKNQRFKYTILKNTDGKYWLYFDEIGKVVDGKYVPNLQPYHEIETSSVLREGAEIWSEDLKSIPEACQLRPMGEYSGNYIVKAKIVNEVPYVAVQPAGQPVQDFRAPNSGKLPGHGKQ